MDADRINVLHVADRNHITGRIAHDLVLDFLPAADIALDKDLVNPGQAQAVGQDLDQFVFIFGNPPAGAPQGISGAQDNRIADGLGEGDSVLDIVNDLGGGNGLSDLLHGVLKALAVFRLENGLGSRADQSDPVLLQKAGLSQLHAKIQPRLTSQGRKNRVRLLFQDDLLHTLRGQRLDIDLVRDLLIRHDGSRVGVD